MNTIKTHKHLLYFLLLLFLSTIGFVSCDNKNKETKTGAEATQQYSNDSDSGKEIVLDDKVSEQIITQIAESNLKIVAIAQKAQESKMPYSARNIFKEIETSHIEIKNEIRKVAKNNFIIIPNTLYDTRTIKNFIDEVSTLMYLTKLETSLLSEQELFNKTNSSTGNKDLKTLITKAIPVIEKNIALIKEEKEVIVNK